MISLYSQWYKVGSTPTVSANTFHHIAPHCRISWHIAPPPPFVGRAWPATHCISLHSVPVEALYRPCGPYIAVLETMLVLTVV